MDFLDKPDWLHTPSDGRGRRIVTVDGVEVDKVMEADTLHGYVVRAVYPYEIDGEDGVVTERLYGVVKVAQMPTTYSDLTGWQKFEFWFWISLIPVVTLGTIFAAWRFS